MLTAATIPQVSLGVTNILSFVGLLVNTDPATVAPGGLPLILLFVIVKEPNWSLGSLSDDPSTANPLISLTVSSDPVPRAGRAVATRRQAHP
jgi:hypothetical protein